MSLTCTVSRSAPRTRVRPPDAGTPFWREEDGSRHSYAALGCGLDRATARALRAAHLGAIGRIAAAALGAPERCDRRETDRLACAAARHCGEIRGLWAPSAAETPTHRHRTSPLTASSNAGWWHDRS
jgi:hypothetical protein